jgi:hypothetical protein
MQCNLLNLHYLLLDIMLLNHAEPIEYSVMKKGMKDCVMYASIDHKW